MSTKKYIPKPTFTVSFSDDAKELLGIKDTKDEVTVATTIKKEVKRRVIIKRKTKPNDEEISEEDVTQRLCYKCNERHSCGNFNEDRQFICEECA